MNILRVGLLAMSGCTGQLETGPDTNARKANICDPSRLKD